MTIEAIHVTWMKLRAKRLGPSNQIVEPDFISCSFTPAKALVVFTIVILLQHYDYLMNMYKRASKVIYAYTRRCTKMIMDCALREVIEAMYYNCNFP